MIFLILLKYEEPNRISEKYGKSRSWKTIKINAYIYEFRFDTIKWH